MATHFSILAWRIPCPQRRLVGYSPGGCRELDTTVTNTYLPTFHWFVHECVYGALLSHMDTQAMINLDSVLKSRDITLWTKVCVVRAMVFSCAGKMMLLNCGAREDS